ncbi:small G protein signaling modulator 3 isoform X1 [Scleropages formosus]|uniref:Small G protein signaling modulator 3 n=1 Tax=Scleropages formosus TaxID=113540 RepID=A0A8C9RF90_SCLFO|nr:small G protein signaling modulator 3 isoform X1 [Scleropages formosus]XP_018593851.1 small G protein signaling modulator 3 isoform X1 [Scleropages formosus]XP_029106320.1 small G protein signaling modulator 3 isoform X1 [Scleropages formosus]XP_029106321.1 small G protein signaling modulator 3 isoform X1 [Scleropages formosus]XP_029106323.1 small G protein signaling modulator 3 isoform X1 [Scleropages formosus]
MSGSYTPTPGGPFSALTPSMWPQDILARYYQKDSTDEPEFQYDEFGFRIDSEDGLELRDALKSEGSPQHEDPQQRLRWQAHLEFTHNHTVGDLTWDLIAPCLARSDRLRALVLGGIPHSMRPQLWMRLSGALQKKRTSEISYKEIIKNSSNDDTTAAKQIEKDLLRTMPSNACFCSLLSVGVPRLRRVLRGLAWLYPDIGYCQGTGMVVSCLLLFLEEEDVLWMMCALIEDLLPPSYFSSTLLGVQTDQRVLRQLIVQYLPRLDRLLQEHDIELSLITLHWFLTAFASVVDIRVLLRIWDLLFYDGSVVLFQVTLGMLKIKEEELVSSENSASIFNTLSDLPSQLEDGVLVLGEAVRLAGTLTQENLEAQRHKHLAYILAEQAQLNSNSSHVLTNNINKVVRRQSQRRKSTLSSLLFGEDEAELLKAKNIKQTELVAALREAIARTAEHFHSLDPRNCSTDLTPDYSMESHQRDHENFVVVSRNRRRRAKALLDFERHDDDELGFRKNDIITIISQKDEHCWVGELNGLRGWFPAKFVEILDERSKEYSLAGDDSVTEAVTDLVRGTLCPALKAIFQHGLKKPSILGGPCHPWLFIEEAASREVERDFNSVYSRLVLCKTYRLDEDGKVLTPEELLYRAVQSVNMSHDSAHAQMDVKFRSLVCVGLNEQVLHLWLEVLCSSLPAVEKWYQPWSFLRSPGWVQIKCELRVLSKFAFSLSQDCELPTKKEEKEQRPLKEGVQDMLVKHHLFSWDIDG